MLSSLRRLRFFFCILAVRIITETLCECNDYFISAIVDFFWKRNINIRRIVSTIWMLFGVVAAVIVAKDILQNYDVEYGKTALVTEENRVEFYTGIADSVDPVEIVPTNELTDDVWENSGGKILIEKCIGEVLDEEKNGRIINANAWGDYISYEGVDCEFGDVVLTYFVYGPDSKDIDDIVARYDYVIEGKRER